MTDTNIKLYSRQALLPMPNNLFSGSNLDRDLYAGVSSIHKHIISDKNKDVMKAIAALKVEPPLTASKAAFLGEEPLEERLFDARAKVKIMTSAVSMYIPPALKEKLFHQIDMLHDTDEWESEDVPVNELSFKSFLAAFIQINPERGPGLGLSYTGNLMANWVTNKNRLIIEFLPNSVKWVITRFIDDEPEHFTGNTKISRLLESLKPYNPEQWFIKNGETDVHS